MSATKNKLTNLTDIPLRLEQGDTRSSDRDISAEKAHKIKSNSLKRFFRSAKTSMTTSKSSDDAADAVCESEMKNVRSLQLRFRSFHKNEDNKKSNAEPSSSTDILKSEPTENRLKLQTRIASYWTTAFKKSTKKSSNNDNAQIDDEITPPQSDIDKFVHKQSPNL